MVVQQPVTGDRQAYLQRAERLSSISTWNLAGKISLDDGEQGGSGRLQWNVGPDVSWLDFYGALGRGAWHLQIGPEGAVLKEANGAMQTADGVNELIQQRMGWPIPVDALRWWVRGLVAPGAIDNEIFDLEGRLVSLQQFGWKVEFNRYESVAGLVLPVRLDAQREQYRVKLAISDWHMNIEND